MKSLNKGVLLVFTLGLLMGGHAWAADSDSPSNGVTSSEEHEAHPGNEPGLDRDRAAYRAKILEEKRLEEEARRKGAGLDRERARQRAEKMEEHRSHEH